MELTFLAIEMHNAKYLMIYNICLHPNNKTLQVSLTCRLYYSYDIDLHM